MASNGTTLPSQKGANGVAKPLNRADEVDDVSGWAFIDCDPLELRTDPSATQCRSITHNSLH